MVIPSNESWNFGLYVHVHHITIMWICFSWQCLNYMDHLYPINLWSKVQAVCFNTAYTRCQSDSTINPTLVWLGKTLTVGFFIGWKKHQFHHCIIIGLEEETEKQVIQAGSFKTNTGCLGQPKSFYVESCTRIFKRQTGEKGKNCIIG